MKMRRPGPGCAVWETTLRCNLTCIHCGSAAGKEREHELSTEESILLCHQLKEINCGGVALMGGEPLLRRDWPVVSKEIKKLNMDLSLITNGYRISENTFDQISAINPDLVTVSIDGASEQVHDYIRGASGAFENAMNSLNRFIEMGLHVGVITTVHKMNLKELKKLREILKGRGIAWQVQIATPFGRLSREMVLSKKEYYSVAMFITSSQREYTRDELMIAGSHDMGYFSDFLPSVQLVPWVGCQAGISTIGIQSDGYVRGCLALHEKFNEGNIRETPLTEIWNDDSFSSYSRYVTESEMKGECRKCKHRNLCKGGCGAVSLSLSGEFHNNPYCLRSIEKEFF